MLARYLDNSYVGDPMVLIIGLNGTLSLWILGRPVDPDDILVSFDVVLLFTCIPTHLAMEVVKERLDFDQSLPERTNLSIQNIIVLLQFVLDNNIFVFQGDHFKQIFGCPMGSPVSAILANLVMEYVEEKALLSAPNSPKWWFRYVDDSHVCIKREHADEFHSHLNSINTNIKFTIEIESDKTMARSPCLYTGKLPTPTATLTSNPITTPNI